MNIIITGGSSGLGRAVVEQMARNKDTVYFTYRTHKENAIEIEKAYPNAHAVYCDFLDDKRLCDLIELIPNIAPDVLINNAYCGYTMGDYFYRTPVDDFERAFTQNVIPLIRVSKEAIKVFRKKKSGRIITVLTSALVGTPPMGYSVYAATKAYIGQLAKQWSKEYAQYGISSNMVSPDFMETGLTQNIDDLTKEHVLNGSPLKRFLSVDEVASVIVNLTSSSNYINGVDIPVNAGVNIL